MLSSARYVSIENFIAVTLISEEAQPNRAPLMMVVISKTALTLDAAVEYQDIASFRCFRLRSRAGILCRHLNR